MNDIGTVVKYVTVDRKNKHVIRYIDGRETYRDICPICDDLCRDIIDLDSHLHVEHKAGELAELGNIRTFLNPVARLREMYETHELTESDYISKGEFFGKKVISNFNQHVLIQIIGKTGTGKSSAAMDLGLAIADYVAAHKGGTANDYFNIDNVAIMQLDSIIPIMESMNDGTNKKQYNVIILDDIGASYGARDFNDIVNKSLNKVFMTFRDTNTVVIVTMPDSFLIDKVLRKLAHFQIEMVEQFFSRGVSFGKLFEMVEQYHQGKTHHHYIRDGARKIQYKYVKFHRPPKEFADEYEAKRTIIRKALMTEAMDKIKDDGDEKGSKKEEKQPKWMGLVGQVKTDLEEQPGITCSELSRVHNVDRGTMAKTINFINQSKSKGRLSDY